MMTCPHCGNIVNGNKLIVDPLHPNPAGAAYAPFIKLNLNNGACAAPPPFVWMPVNL